MKRTKKNCRIFGIALAVAVLYAVVLSSGILYTADQTVADGLYQSERALDGTVIVIGITGEDLENFGVWPWDRSIMAAVLETLNRDEELRPAAIGVDTLYVSHTNPESDAALVEAAKAGNVVLACSAEFDSTLQFAEDGNAYMDDFSLQALDLPFPELREQAVLGHINAMYDVDGVLRHHLWAVPDGNGGEILSMPWQLYSMYCGYWGEEPDYTPALNRSGFWYVDYSAKPGTYLEYSVSDILSDNYDPYLLSGAIVLIGPYDPALTDSFIAPIERAEQMYGVEYMANVTSAMLNGTVKKEVSDILQVILVTVLCFLLLVGFAHLRMLFMVPGFVVITAGMVGIARLLYLQGRVVHPLWFPLGAVIGFVVAVINHYAVAAGDKKAIRNVFGRYVDPHIMQDLLREDSDSLGLEGKSCNIAVLFVDIRGFTSMSEGMAPEQVVKILNEYLTLTSDSVRKNGGTLDKFVGDCTMAFWGAPMPCEDPIYQACCAARDMVEGSRELGKRLEEQFGRSVAFGIGVHYGPAVVGNIGSDFRMDYTAIGDTVNTASRLESNAPKGTIYVSRAVVDALGDRADVTKTGPIHLKGKTDGFEIFTLDHLR